MIFFHLNWVMQILDASLNVRQDFSELLYRLFHCRTPKRNIERFSGSPVHHPQKTPSPFTSAFACLRTSWTFGTSVTKFSNRNNKSQSCMSSLCPLRFFFCRHWFSSNRRIVGGLRLQKVKQRKVAVALVSFDIVAEHPSETTKVIPVPTWMSHCEFGFRMRHFGLRRSNE